MTDTTTVRICALPIIALATCFAQAQQTEGQTEGQIEEQTEEKTTTWALSGGDVYQFDSDIDGGGSFSENRFFIGGGLSYEFTPSLTIDFKVASEIDDYDFKGGGAFTAPADGTPWKTTADITMRGLGRWKVDDNWRVFLGGVVSWAAETDADLAKAITGGGLFGASYTFSEDLTLGAGVQISTRLEDDLLYIPSPIIDWRITEQLFISNMRAPVGYPASLGVEVVYYLSQDLNVSVGSRYEYRRFRLNESGPSLIHNGVGTNSGFPVWLRFEWRPIPEIRLHLLGGVTVAQKLELDDRNGNTLSKADVGTSPFVGLFLGFEF
jgi:hypothetical protein